MNSNCPYKSFLNSTNNTSMPNYPSDLPGEELIDDTLLTINPSSMSEEGDNSKCPYSNKKGNVSGCPFMNSQNTEPKDSKFSFHFEIPLPQKGRDFYFNKLNYTKETRAKSTWLHSMPLHLRNTLFIKNEKIDLIRQKEYSVVFLITEEMKEKANELYEKKEYSKAIGAYTMIYSVFKWLVFKSKEKETKCIKEYNFSNENAIIDEDIELKRITTDSSLKYEEDSYRTCVIYVLKSLSYCYMHLRAYSEAVKCMEEAIGYASASLPDVLLRKSQAIMYNKFSSELILSKALSDIETAKCIKKTKMIEDHLVIISTIIEEKKKQRFDRVKKLIESTAYANNVVKKKNLDVNEHIYFSYDEIHFNHKIVIEMKDLYYSTIKFFQDTNNDKQLERIYNEFDQFFDFYYPYMAYYQLLLGNIQQDILDQLSQEDKELIKEGETNQTIRLLFNDFRLKKCQELYNDMEWNMQLWKFCFDTVNEREKEKKKEEDKNKKASQSLYKKLTSPFSKPSHYIIFSLILITASMVLIGFHYIYYDNKNKKPI